MQRALELSGLTKELMSSLQRAHVKCSQQYIHECYYALIKEYMQTFIKNATYGHIHKQNLKYKAHIPFTNPP